MYILLGITVLKMSFFFFFFKSVMKNDTDTETMQKEAMTATEQVGRKKTDTETGDTERKKRLGTSHLEGLVWCFF